MTRKADLDDSLFDDIASLLDAVEASPTAEPFGDASPSLVDVTVAETVVEDDLESWLSGDGMVDMATNTHTDTRQVVPSRSTACRMRQREEIQYLRRQVQELEDELARLQHVKWSPSLSTSRDDDCEASGASSKAAWERIAKRQMNTKQKAEAENLKLREMLQGQLKIARGLEKLLRKRSSQQAGEELVQMKRQKRLDSTDDELYNRLMGCLGDRFREVDAVFQSNGLAASRNDVEDTRILDRGTSGFPMVEVLYGKVFPFDFASVSEAVWRCSTMSFIKLSRGFYSAQPVSDDEVKARFELPLQLRRQNATLHVHVAMRRRFEQEQEREVYAWESFSTLKSDHYAYDGVELHDHGWTIVQRLPCSDASDPVAIVKCCSRLVLDERSLPTQNPIGVINDVLIASYNRNYATLCETVENTLLEETLGLQNST